MEFKKNRKIELFNKFKQTHVFIVLMFDDRFIPNGHIRPYFEAGLYWTEYCSEYA